MNDRIIFRTLVMLCLLSALTASSVWGLSMTRMSPNLDQFICKTIDPLQAVFDRSIDGTTLDDDTFYITIEGQTEHLAGTLSLTSTNLTNDTIIFTPDTQFEFGAHYQIQISVGLLGLDTTPFDGVYPEGEIFVANIPNDFEIPTWDPDDIAAIFIESNMLVGFDPLDPEGTDWEDYSTFPGMSATEAWKITTGNPKVIIGVIDNGMKSMNSDELRDNYFLNRGELPLPNVAGVECLDYDCNEDGRFNWRDYEHDSRLAGSPNAWPGTLIELFKDGVDDDGNGLKDDISGYDFFRDVPEAEGVGAFPEGAHGGGRAEDAGAQADNGRGNKPGVCPNCTILPIRVGDAILGDFNVMAYAAEYANEMGAQILIVANGTYNYSDFGNQLFEDLYRKGTLTIAASGDENGFHHIFPAAGEFVMSIKAVLPVPNANIDIGDLLGIEDLEWEVQLGDIATFVESYCTNFGAHISVTAPTGACSSHATSITAGMAGLILSRAVDLGIELSSNELMQIIQMTSDDIFEKCLTITKGNCKPGWDSHWGYGRVNALTAVRALGDPAKGIPAKVPPEVEITSPKWFDLYHPAKTPSLDIEGMVFARGDSYQYDVAYAVGVEPDDNEFIVLETGSGTSATEGKLATLDLTSIFDEMHLEMAPSDPEDFTVTLKVRAWKDVEGETVFGEYRKAFAVYNDFEEKTGLLPGFPIEMEASAESSVVLWDLTGKGKGKKDIIFGGGDGIVRVYRYSDQSGAWEMAPGFPVDCNLPENKWPDSIIGSTAVGDLFGDQTYYIVVTTFNGHVFAIHPNGNLHTEGGDPAPFLEGFPVTVKKGDPYPNIGFGHGTAYISSPALGDLDQDGMLEIITTNYNKNVYAIRPVDEDQDGVADFLPGWPVLASSLPGAVPPELECGRYEDPASILVSPAVAVLDPYSMNPDIAEHLSVIVGTGEVCVPRENEFPDIEMNLDTGRVYAIHHDGNDNPNGPFVEGWPASVIAPLGGAIPIPPLTIGVVSSPVVANDGGRTYIGTGTFLWPPAVISWEDGEMDTYMAVNLLGLGASATGTFAHFSDNGKLQYIVPTVGLNFSRLLGEAVTMNFQLSVFNVDSLFIQEADGPLDDANFFINPIVADLNDDGLPEMIAGSGGYLLHAFDINGDEPLDWPKYTGHFIIASPQVSDMDGDGLLEVVLADHEGKLFAWNTTGSACNPKGGAPEWYRYRHDEHNSGWLNNDIRPPQAVWDLLAYHPDQDNEDLVALRLTAPGDDWGCGYVRDFDLRYATDPDTDLTDPKQFAAAKKVPAADIGEIPLGGEQMMIKLELPGAVKFALRTTDDSGNVSMISNEAEATIGLTTDESEDSGADDDSNDDDGCCGS